MFFLAVYLLHWKKYSWKVRWWSGVFCSCYWSLILQMESLLAFIGKNWFSFDILLRAERLHVSNHAVVREHWSEHTEAVNSSRNGFHVAARADPCPAASVFSAVTVVFQLECGSEVTCHIIIYYSQHTELCTYSSFFWLKPLVLTLSSLTFPSCSEMAEQRLDHCSGEICKPFRYKRFYLSY